MLAALERAEDATEHRGDLAEIVVELSNSGLDAYFLVPLKDAKAGFVLQQSAKLGMAGAKQVMAPVIRQVIGRMERRSCCRCAVPSGSS